MCGIAGIVGGGPPDPALLDRMAACMAHRGPDGQGLWHDDSCGMAFRRLAIIDLDERSDQPLHFERWHLVFNGEIYNYLELREELRALGHRFETEGDGEVLLHAWAQWGEAALQRVNGMFAFAVWDDRERSLTLASDPFGEKPVLWAQRDGRLLFASDAHSLIEADPSLGAPDDAALGPFLALGLMPPIERTFFEHVHRLPGAHLLRWRDGRFEVERYWAPEPVAVPGRYEDAVESLRELLLDAIRLRLRADVPVGTSLSGGIDSSAIVGLSAQLAGDHRRHAFTARFPGYERDEWHFASLAAEAAGVVEHHAVSPTADELARDLPALVRRQEEPAGSASVYAQWRVMQAAREAGVTVLLDGQGADELFAGYPGGEGWARRSRGLVQVARGLAGADRMAVLDAIGAERMPRAVARRRRRGRATPYAHADVVHLAVALEPPSAAGASPLQRELLRQALHTSLPQLLRYADRDSMAHSREVRLPFLDRRIANFALSLPPEFLVRDGVRKAVLRDAVRDVVPPAILERRDKVGFEPPQARWLASPPLLEIAREVLLGRDARTGHLLDRPALARDAAAGAWSDHAGLWRALNLELWLREVAQPRPRAEAAA